MTLTFDIFRSKWTFVPHLMKVPLMTSVPCSETWNWCEVTIALTFWPPTTKFWLVYLWVRVNIWPIFKEFLSRGSRKILPWSRQADAQHENVMPLATSITRATNFISTALVRRQFWNSSRNNCPGLLMIGSLSQSIVVCECESSLWQRDYNDDHLMWRGRI